MGIDDNHGGSSSSSSWGVLLPPSVAPMMSSGGGGGGGGGGGDREEHWRSFDNSVNAVSFGFVATAILISMFLVMAIFERFLRPRSSSTAAGGGGGRNSSDLEGQTTVHGKHNNYPSPKMTVYARGVSVLMPGDEIPTFIAHPAPAPALAPCPPECVSRPPPHYHDTNPSLSSISPMHNNTPPSALH